MKLQKHLQSFPFIAITRGLKPAKAVACCEILYNSGFRIIENPLNSPDPYASIQLMAATHGDRALIGAGTVLTTQQVERVKEAGGKAIISPNCNIDVIKKTKECGLISIPGVATPTEAFAALNAGADALKLFPAETIQVSGLKAMMAVLPANTMMIPVGGIDSENWQPYLKAGAVGCGLGSSLYNAEISDEELRIRSTIFSTNWQAYS